MAGELPVGALAPLRITAYRRLWYATTISHLGTYLQLTVAPWLMLLMTGSPFLVGLITTALFLPRLVLTIPAGLLSDRLDRRLVLALGYATCSLSAGALAVATSLDRLSPTLLLVLTAGLGTGSAIAKPAHQTFLPDMVPPSLRTPAITLNSASAQTARIVGPSIGGAFVAFGRADLAFAANSLSFVVVLLALLVAPDPDRDRRTGGGGAPRGVTGMLAGITYVRSNRAIRDLLLVTATFVLGAVSVQALLPNIVADGLGLGATAYGVLYGVFGLGAVAGAVSRERVAAQLQDATASVSMVAFGVSSVALSWTAEPLVAAACLLLIGVTWVWTMTTLNAAVQLGAPRWVRGRVIALFVLAVATKPVGAALAGTIAEFASLRAAFTVAGALTVVTGVIASRFPVSAVRVVPDGEEEGDPARDRMSALPHTSSPDESDVNDHRGT